MAAKKFKPRQTLYATILLCLAGAAGCKNFFPPLNTGTGGTGTTNTGDYAYVASSDTSLSSDLIYTISGFAVGTNSLTPLSGSPITLAFPPKALVVSPSNEYLYVVGTGPLSGVIYGYSIASTGVLTAIQTLASSPVLGTANAVSMVISPDGKWLLALDANSNIVVVDEYSIDSSTGLLTLQTGVQYSLTGTSATIVPSSIAVAPNSAYVAVALGTGGDVLFNFDTSTGDLTFASQVTLLSATSGNQALVFNSNASTLYVAQSGTNAGVVPYNIGANGSLTAAAGSPFSLGTASNASGASSILIDKTGTYLYVGNKVSSTISGFAVGASGLLTPLTSSPYASGTNVNSLGADNSGKYILSTALNGNPDLKMFSFDATALGQLDVAAVASTGTTEPAGAVAVALTH